MNRRIALTLVGLLLLTASLSATDFDGIWVGQQPGRNGEVEDLAFRLKVAGASITGKMFGDEFDLPISEGTINGDQIRFVVTTNNYYNRIKTQFVYTGTLKGGILELVRERLQGPEVRAGAKNGPGKQTLKLHRLN
jgi:hypothetical protein